MNKLDIKSIFIAVVTQKKADILKSEVINEIDEVEKIENKDDYFAKKFKIFEIIKHFIFSRTNFEYGYADIIQYFLWWIFIRNKIKVRNIYSYWRKYGWYYFYLHLP